MAESDPKQELDRRAPSPACSVCGHTEWFTAKEGKPITFLSFEAKDDPRIRVLALGCLNCGYMRFHALEVLEQQDG